MPRVLKVTLTYVQRIQLAPYNHVDAGMIVEVEPDASEDGPDAIRDLAGLIATTWATVGPATAAQVRTAVTEFDLLMDERRSRRQTRESAPHGEAAFAPTEPPPATGRQRETIGLLRESLGWTVGDLDAFAERVGLDMARLTAGDARALLQAMHLQPPKRRPPTADPATIPEDSPPEDHPGSDAPAAPPDDPPAPPPEPPGGPPAPPASVAAPPPPQTAAEAEKRFYSRYGAAIGGTTFPTVRAYIGEATYPKPATVEAWIALAETVRDRIKAQKARTHA